MFTSVVVSRCSRATTARKCTNQRDPRTKLLFCQSKPIAFLPSSLPSLSSLLKLPTNVPLKTMKQRPCWWPQKSSGTWIGLFSSHVKNVFSLKNVADHVSENDLYCINMILQPCSGCCRLRKSVAESREKLCSLLYMLRVLPTQGKLILQQVT